MLPSTAKEMPVLLSPVRRIPNRLSQLVSSWGFEYINLLTPTLQRWLFRHQHRRTASRERIPATKGLV